ncbi:glycosyltransferase [Streptomyces sp. NPDC059740]|uniref:glycosyltransferase n=1 Tax=Streptomyces sp. NPDC059740 TaxID=3346926 RepID=UPI003669283E
MVEARGAGAGRSTVAGVVVAVPAHDEAETLADALAGVRRAAAHRELAQVPVVVAVAADSCRDGTADLARSLGAEVVEVAVRSAGAARAAAVRHGLHVLGLPAGEVWVATTDADSVPDPQWLAHQLRCARSGWDAVAGTVVVGSWPAGYPAAAILRYAEHYARGLGPDGGHGHVHGANLGVRADAYLRCGGFPALVTGEDRALVTALQAAGVPLLRSRAHPVVTSARTDARAPGGLGALLCRLQQPDGVEPAA